MLDALQIVCLELLIILVDTQRSRATQLVASVLSHVELLERRELGGLMLASGDVLVGVSPPLASGRGHLWRWSRVRDAPVLKVFVMRVYSPVTCAGPVSTQLLSPHLVGLRPSLGSQGVLRDPPRFLGVQIGGELFQVSSVPAMDS